MSKQDAIKLRRQGLSYNEITKKLGTPKSTLSYWLRDIKLSKVAQKRISNNKFTKSTLKLIERNKNQTLIAQEKYKNIIDDAIIEYDNFKNEKLFIAGVSLYWAEGYKKGAKTSKLKVIDFANSDEQMISLMMIFFRRYLNVPEDKFRIQIIVHPNINIEKSTSKWSTVTKIHKSQFIKTYSKAPTSSKGIRNKKSLPFGTAHIRIYDVNQFFRIIGWIEALKIHFKI